MRHEDMAWEFVSVFDELSTKQINEMLAKNVPLESLRFFNQYAMEYGEADGLSGETLQRLPNLMLIGYLLRVLEERLIEDEEVSDE